MKQRLLDQCQTICANLVAYCAIIMTNKGISNTMKLLVHITQFILYGSFELIS